MGVLDGRVAIVLLLCSAEPTTLTGRITYSQELPAELGGPAPARG